MARRGAERNGAEQRSVTLRRTHRVRLLRTTSERTRVLCVAAWSVFLLVSSRASVSSDVQERRSCASDVRRIGRG